MKTTHCILLKYKDLNLEDWVDLQTLVYRFHRLDLVYFALEIIYLQELSKGYENFCSHIMPKGRGKMLKDLISHKLKYDIGVLMRCQVVCPQTGLELLKYILSIPNSEAPLDYDNIMDGYDIRGFNLLAIVLKINERIVNSYAEINETDDVKNTIATAALISSVENNDIINFNFTTPLTHLYKAVMLLAFCQSNSYLSEYVPLFLKKYNCPDVRTYVHTMLRLLCENNNIGYSCCKFTFSDNKEIPAIFREFSTSINEIVDVETNNDYKVFREKPLIKISQREYIVISNSLLASKIYNGLLFDFTKLSGNGNKVREIISSEFTETLLLYPILNSIIFPKSPFHLSGADCQKIDPKRAPDYYIRNWGDIFLVELKDYSFRADIKSSPSLDVINDYLKTQFVVKSNGRDGALRQLIYNIKSIYNKDFVWDKQIDKVNNIYPILVLGNSTYMTPGLPYKLAKMFKLELFDANLRDEKIRDLTILDIDTLILYQDFFSDGKHKFKTIIDNYHRYIHRDYKHSSNQELQYAFMMSFPEYLKTYHPISAIHLKKKILND